MKKIILVIALGLLLFLLLRVSSVQPFQYYENSRNVQEESSALFRGAPPVSNGLSRRLPALDIFSGLFKGSLGDFFSNQLPMSGGTFGFQQVSPSSAEQYLEIKKILETRDIVEQSDLYRQLIERVGPTEAQEALYRSGLPFTGETHLIQHVVGQYLYETEGKEGVSKCTLYFLAACYHEFIIFLLTREGVEALPEVMDECWKFGISVSSQCAHGIGHGFLIWYGYKNLDKAAAGCVSLSESSPNFPLTNCLDGTFMENQWALHPSATSEDQWLSKTDPYYPCTDPRLKEEWLVGCWLNQGSLMYQMFFQGDIGKVSDACLGVENSYFRELCFDSLARQIHPLAQGDYQETLRLCGMLAPGWDMYCIKTVATSDFAVGGRDLSYRICERIAAHEKSDCYFKLFNVMGGYAMSKEDLASFCAPISEAAYRSQCLASKQF